MENHNEKVSDILNFISKQGGLTLDHFDRKDMDDFKLYVIGLYERLVKGIRSIQQLLLDKEGELTHEFSIGLIIRTLCLDSLIVYYLSNTVNNFDKSKDSDEKNYETLVEIARRGFSEGLTYAADTAKKAFDSGLFESNEHYLSYVDNYVKKHKNYFQDYTQRGKVPKLKYMPLENGWNLAKNLLKTDFKHFSGLYFSYDVYSKYEHYGLLYYEVKHGNREEKKKEFLAICEKFIYTNALLGVLMSFNSSDLFLQQLNHKNTEFLQNYIDLNHPV
jgi:hypothetical protein